MLLFKTVIYPKLLNQTFEEQEIKNLQILKKRSLKRIEGWLTDQTYLTGEEMSIADLLAVCELRTLEMMGETFEKWPKISA